MSFQINSAPCNIYNSAIEYLTFDDLCGHFLCGKLSSITRGIKSPKVKSVMALCEKLQASGIITYVKIFMLLFGLQQSSAPPKNCNPYKASL